MRAKSVKAMLSPETLSLNDIRSNLDLPGPANSSLKILDRPRGHAQGRETCTNPTFLFRVQGKTNPQSRGNKQTSGAMSKESGGCVIQQTVNTSFFLWPIGKKSRHVFKPVPENHKKAGPEPQRSIKLNRAEVLVMETFSDLTARATADRKALSADTQMAAPSHR